MPSDDYKKRLSNWVAEERRRLGRLDGLEVGEMVAMTRLELEIIRVTGQQIDRSALKDWQEGRYVRAISDERLSRLALYRGETIDECRWWLEGKSEKPGKDTISDTDVIWWIANCEDPGKLLQIVQLASRRSAELISGKENP
jgi:hypothetical protein